MVKFAKFRGKINKRVKLISTFVLLVVLVLVIVIGAIVHEHHSKTEKIAQAKQEIMLANTALTQGDNAKALQYAKEALAKQPNSVGNLELVANLTTKSNPKLAKQYYVREFNAYKQQNNVNSPSMTAVNYYAVAQMAQQAGENDQAIKYYQLVMTKARSSNAYEQSLAMQSRNEILSLRS